MARDSWSWPIECSGCSKPYSPHGFLYVCPDCGGVFDLKLPLPVEAVDDQRPSRRGLARYRRSLPLPPDAPLISLGEGGTSLLPLTHERRTVYLKCEHLNPTGSFKDRGTAVIVSALLAAGVHEAVEDSSGNAGASFAAYCARAGIRASVYVPAYAAGPKCAQIESMGAEIIVIPGPRSAAAEAVRKRAESGCAYASHAHLPHGLAGMATLAYEITDQLGRAPGTLVLPVGQGTLLLGAYYGFQSLLAAGRIDSLPRFVAVQARACAPIWNAHTRGEEEAGAVVEGETLAEGIRIMQPIRMDAVLSALRDSGGSVVAVGEEEIEHGRDALARAGFYVEPTSAVVWPALDAIADAPDPVVVVLTGSGFKDPKTA